jgi:hypothetical protein
MASTRSKKEQIYIMCVTEETALGENALICVENAISGGKVYFLEDRDVDFTMKA